MDDSLCVFADLAAAASELDEPSVDVDDCFSEELSNVSSDESMLAMTDSTVASPTSMDSSTSTTSSVKRHNMGERRRRECIRDAFLKLQRKLLYNGVDGKKLMTDKRLSKVQTIRITVERITRLKEEIKTLEGRLSHDQ